MIESKREITRDPEGKGEDYPKFWRVCKECERKLRLMEWSSWSQTQQNDDPSYCEPHRIEKDLKMMKTWVCGHRRARS